MLLCVTCRLAGSLAPESTWLPNCLLSWLRWRGLCLCTTKRFCYVMHYLQYVQIASNITICFVWCFLFRVLCVGGTLVLLLSPQLSCLLKKLLEENHTESSSKHESKPQAGHHSYPDPPSLSARRDTLQINQDIHSSSTKETGRQSALRTFQSSLKHQETFRVSLGLIDGIIHKYVKMNIWLVSVELDSFTY